MKREVRVQDAVGMVLAHDLTRIVPGEFKGRLFSRGHVISESDIEKLLAIGKEHIYALTLEPGELHEDDAARRMAGAIRHDSLTFTEPHEGKITVKSAMKGLLRIDVERLHRVNRIDDLALVTKRTWTAVEMGSPVAGLRAIPLITSEDKVIAFEREARMDSPLIEVLPYRSAAVGVVTTGSEIFKGRIEDRFGPVLEEKLKPFGVRYLGQKIVDDQTAEIVAAIRRFVDEKADVVLVTGGMSVDPDDRSPGAIKAVATEVVSYGMPVLPGSMSMIAYAGHVTLMGLPGCVIYDPITSFDWLLPRVLAGIRLTRDDLAELGHGGLM